MNKKKDFTERDYNRISLIFAVLMANGVINYVVGQMYDMGGMVVSLSILALVVVYCYKTMVKVKIPASALTLIILISVFYLVTRQLYVTTLFGRYFMFYFLAASFLGLYKCNSESFLRYTSYAVLLIMPLYNDIFVEMTSTRFNTSISMGLSYSLFPVLMAPIVHFVFYRKQSKFLMKLIYVISAFLLVSLVFKGNRGIVLSLVVFVAMLFISGMDFKKKKGIKILKLSIVLILTGVLVVYFYEILGFLQRLLESMNIEAHFVDKILKLENAGDVTNGRKDIFEYTSKAIVEEPILGHGLGTILYNSGFRIIYPHNIFLQLLYDGGLVLFIPVVFALVQAVHYTFMGEDRDEAVFTLFLIVIFLPRAFVSGDIWETEALWLLVMHSFKFYVKQGKKVKVKNQRDVVVKVGTLSIDSSPDSEDEETEVVEEEKSDWSSL